MSQTAEYQTGPNKHFIQAMYNWIVENGGSPHIIVAITEIPDKLHRFAAPKAEVMMLNISPRACGGLLITDDAVSFNCRFQGVEHSICISTTQIYRIYDRDAPEVHMDLQVSTPVAAEPVVEKKRPSLSVVK